MRYLKLTYFVNYIGSKLKNWINSSNFYFTRGKSWWVWLGFMIYQPLEVI